jgi:hypothetical protein
MSTSFEFSFAPIEDENLPDYTSVAEFNLGPETLATTPAETAENKATPLSPQERLELVRHYVGMIAGEDAMWAANEFLTNDREDHRVTHLSVGTLTTGETVVIATDDNPQMVQDAGREQSINPAIDAEDDELLTGDELDAALAALGENGRGFMGASGLAVDGAVHVTPARDETGKTYGKNLWVVVEGPEGGRGDTQLAA